MELRSSTPRRSMRNMPRPDYSIFGSTASHRHSRGHRSPRPDGEPSSGRSVSPSSSSVSEAKSKPRRRVDRDILPKSLIEGPSSSDDSDNDFEESEPATPPLFSSLSEAPATAFRSSAGAAPSSDAPASPSPQRRGASVTDDSERGLTDGLADLVDVPAVDESLLDAPYDTDAFLVDESEPPIMDEALDETAFHVEPPAGRSRRGILELVAPLTPDAGWGRRHLSTPGTAIGTLWRSMWGARGETAATEQAATEQTETEQAATEQTPVPTLSEPSPPPEQEQEQEEEEPAVEAEEIEEDMGVPVAFSVESIDLDTQQHGETFFFALRNSLSELLVNIVAFPIIWVAKFVMLLRSMFSFLATLVTESVRGLFGLLYHVLGGVIGSTFNLVASVLWFIIDLAWSFISTLLKILVGATVIGVRVVAAIVGALAKSKIFWYFIAGLVGAWLLAGFYGAVVNPPHGAVSDRVPRLELTPSQVAEVAEVQQKLGLLFDQVQSISGKLSDLSSEHAAVKPAILDADVVGRKVKDLTERLEKTAAALGSMQEHQNVLGSKHSQLDADVRATLSKLTSGSVGSDDHERRIQVLEQSAGTPAAAPANAATAEELEHIRQDMIQRLLDESARTQASLGKLRGDINDRLEALSNAKDSSDEIAELRSSFIALDGELSSLKAHTNELRGLQGETRASVDALDKRIDTVRISREVGERLAADTIGVVDHALRTGGAIIVPALTSAPFEHANGGFWLTKLLSLGERRQPPSIMLDSRNQRGECYALAGHSGTVGVKLAYPVRPTGFSIDHIPQSIALDSAKSAPHKIEIYGISEDGKSVRLVEGAYDLSGSAVQTFSTSLRSAFSTFQLRVLSNHGHESYTCVYRFRVHGQKV